MEIDPQVIIVFLMVLFAGAKALYEKFNPPKEEEYYEPSLEEIHEEMRQRNEEFKRQAELEELEQQYEQAARTATPPTSNPPALPALPAQPATRPPDTSPKRARLTPAEVEALKNFQKSASPSRSKRAYPSTKARLKRHLSSPTAAREALLLSEVFGKPKALIEE